MTQAADIQGMSMTLGEVKGQLREVVHTMNNMSQKLDAVAADVAAARDLPIKLAALDVRVTALEAAENKRVGAMGFGGWLLRMIPIGLVSALIGAVANFFTGRHP